MKERAAKLIASGQLERGEVVLRQTLTQAPRDVQLWLRHAEVLKKLARSAGAVSSYRLAARILDEDGHHERAVAALKLALALVPEDVDVYAEIIRCELRAQKTTAGLRAAFPLSSPSQLLSGAPVRESGLYAGVPGQGLDDPPPRLALPMSTSATVTAPRPRTMAAAAGSDTWKPEPTPPPLRATQRSAPEEVRPPPETEPTSVTVPPPAPSAPVRFEVDVVERWPHVRRLSERQVAIRGSPEAQWVVVEAAGPLTIRFEPLLEIPDEAEWLE